MSFREEWYNISKKPDVAPLGEAGPPGQQLLRPTTPQDVQAITPPMVKPTQPSVIPKGGGIQDTQQPLMPKAGEHPVMGGPEPDRGIYMGGGGETAMRMHPEQAGPPRPPMVEDEFGQWVEDMYQGTIDVAGGLGVGLARGATEPFANITRILGPGHESAYQAVYGPSGFFDELLKSATGMEFEESPPGSPTHAGNIGGQIYGTFWKLPKIVLAIGEMVVGGVKATPLITNVISKIMQATSKSPKLTTLAEKGGGVVASGARGGIAGGIWGMGGNPEELKFMEDYLGIKLPEGPLGHAIMWGTMDIAFGVAIGSLVYGGRKAKRPLGEMVTHARNFLRDAEHKIPTDSHTKLTVHLTKAVENSVLLKRNEKNLILESIQETPMSQADAHAMIRRSHSDPVVAEQLNKVVDKIFETSFPPSPNAIAEAAIAQKVEIARARVMESQKGFEKLQAKITKRSKLVEGKEWKPKKPSGKLGVEKWPASAHGVGDKVMHKGKEWTVQAPVKGGYRLKSNGTTFVISPDKLSGLKAAPLKTTLKKRPWEVDTKLKPRAYQERYPEKTVHEDWNLANSPRFDLEAGGDILREFQKKHIDPSYIKEKLVRIMRLVKGEMSGKIHPTDSIGAAKRHAGEKLERLISQYESQPVSNEGQRLAKAAILDVMKGKFDSASQKYMNIEKNLEVLTRGK